MSVSSTERLSYRERLDRFYRRYDPSKIPHIDSLLGRFEHHEQEMFNALAKKYGPEPSPSGHISLKPCRERLKLRVLNFYKFYNPEKLEMVDDIADGYWEDGEEELFKSLVERYGPEPMVASDGTVRRAPRRHRGLAMTDESRRATAAKDDDDDFDLGHNSDEDLLDKNVTDSVKKIADDDLI